MSLQTEAKKLLVAEQAVKTAKGALEEAERVRAKARERCRPLVATGVTTRTGDIEITVTPCVSGKSFRIAEYLRAHKLTKAMEPFVGGETPYDRWTVKRAAV
jgi:hypothetical protein